VCRQGLGSKLKRFKRLPRANHNDLYQTHPHEYSKELAGFFDQVFGRGNYEQEPGDVVRARHHYCIASVE